MSVIGLVSAKGSPGVTTLALAAVLARADQGAVLLEADGAGGDVALWHGVPQAPGLAELAARAMHAGLPRQGVGAFGGWVRPLAGGALPVVIAPVEGQGVRAALGVIARRAAVLDTADQLLVVDFGRLSSSSAAWPVLDACDVLLLVTRGDIAALGHAQNLAKRLQDLPPRVMFALIDTGPYRVAEAHTALGLPCAGVMPFNVKHARALQEPAAVRSLYASPLVTAAGKLLAEACAANDGALT